MVFGKKKKGKEEYIEEEEEGPVDEGPSYMKYASKPPSSNFFGVENKTKELPSVQPTWAGSRRGFQSASPGLSHMSPMLTVQRPEGSYESSSDAVMTQFKQTEEDIKLLEKSVRDLKDVLRDQYWALSAEDGDRANEFVSQVHRKAMGIKRDLKQLESIVQQNNSALSGTEQHMYQNMLTKLRKKFVEQLQEIDDQQNRVKKSLQQRAYKQSAIANPDMEYNGEVDEDYHMDAQQQDQIFQSQIIETQREHERAKRALIYAQDAHQEIIEIERQIAELHQMFVDMSTLVQVQGEFLNPIAHNLEVAVHGSNRGMEVLEIAESSRLSSRKKKLLIAAIILGGITVVVVGAIIIVAAICVAAGVFA